jgi:ribose 5-phosphate isomerase A
MTPQEMKIEASRAALEHVRDGMTVGLGTGSTAAEFVKLLAAKKLTGIRATSTSNATEDLARSLGIPMFALHEIAPLDVAIDGADEIDARLRLIKGRGGALLREKIVEQAAKKFIVIADESKVVERLGAGILPVEVTPFALQVLQKRFTQMGFGPVLRMADGKPRITDEGHVILDMKVPANIDIADVVARIREQAGVVETGFFPTEASEAVIASPTGIRVMKR